MKKTLIFLFVLTLVLGTVGTAKAIIYTGSLTGNGGGIVTTGGWNSSSTVFSWEVMQVGALWEYDYTFTVPTKGISHLIIEVSPDTTRNDFSAGLWDIYSSTNQGNSNPGMPGEMTGLKINTTGDNVYTLNFSFTSPRAPVWGDFYAKDGREGGNDGIWVTAWNAGFTNPDTDPTVGPINGSIDFHILRPDTATTVPEPGVLILLGIAMTAAGVASRWIRRI